VRLAPSWPLLKNQGDPGIGGANKTCSLRTPEQATADEYRARGAQSLPIKKGFFLVKKGFFKKKSIKIKFDRILEKTINNYNVI
jgi:hypothetical protein